MTRSGKVLKKSGYSFLKVFAIFYAITMTVMLGFGIFITVVSKQADSLDTVNFNRQLQVRNDWTQTPFVEINVREGECLEGEDPVFIREWKGTGKGCEMLGNNPRILDYETWDRTVRCTPNRNTGNSQLCP